MAPGLGDRLVGASLLAGSVTSVNEERQRARGAWPTMRRHRPEPPSEPPPEQGGRPGRRRGWVKWVRRALAVAILIAAVVAASTQTKQLEQGADLLGNIRWGWLVVAIVFELASLVVFARLQTLRPLKGRSLTARVPIVSEILALSVSRIGADATTLIDSFNWPTFIATLARVI